MDTLKQAPVTVADAQAMRQSLLPARPNRPSRLPPIHWALAPPDPVSKIELEQKFEAMRARNWITDRMVQQYQRHWHCTREAALERLLAKVGRLKPLSKVDCGNRALRFAPRQ